MLPSLGERSRGLLERNDNGTEGETLSERNCMAFGLLSLRVTRKFSARPPKTRFRVLFQTLLGGLPPAPVPTKIYQLTSCVLA